MEVEKGLIIRTYQNGEVSYKPYAVYKDKTLFGMKKSIYTLGGPTDGLYLTKNGWFSTVDRDKAIEVLNKAVARHNKDILAKQGSKIVSIDKEIL